MGTRGAFGFKIKEELKVTYNQYDSYPGGLGQSVLSDLKKLLKKYSIEELKEKIENIKLVNSESTPTSEEIIKLKKYYDSTVSSGSEKEWYCLLRRMQGELAEHVDAGYMIDGKEFLKDTLFCEYSYIVNLDNECFELYDEYPKLTLKIPFKYLLEINGNLEDYFYGKLDSNKFYRKDKLDRINE